MRLILTLLAVASLLIGCGLKDDLYLPDSPTETTSTPDDNEDERRETDA